MLSKIKKLIFLFMLVLYGNASYGYHLIIINDDVTNKVKFWCKAGILSELKKLVIDRDRYALVEKSIDDIIKPAVILEPGQAVCLEEDVKYNYEMAYSRGGFGIKILSSAGIDSDIFKSLTNNDYAVIRFSADSGYTINKIFRGGKNKLWAATISEFKYERILGFSTSSAKSTIVKDSNIQDMNHGIYLKICKLLKEISTKNVELGEALKNNNKKNIKEIIKEIDKNIDEINKIEDEKGFLGGRLKKESDIKLEKENKNTPNEYNLILINDSEKENVKFKYFIESKKSKFGSETKEVELEPGLSKFIDYVHLEKGLKYERGEKKFVNFFGWDGFAEIKSTFFKRDGFKNLTHNDYVIVRILPYHGYVVTTMVKKGDVFDVEKFYSNESKQSEKFPIDSYCGIFLENRLKFIYEFNTYLKEKLGLTRVGPEYFNRFDEEDKNKSRSNVVFWPEDDIILAEKYINEINENNDIVRVLGGEIKFYAFYENMEKYKKTQEIKK